MLVSDGRLAFPVNQALLHWIGGLERSEVHVEQIPRRHECDHFGAEIDDVKIGAVSRMLANAGNSRSGRFPWNVGVFEALKGDRRRSM